MTWYYPSSKTFSPTQVQALMAKVMGQNSQFAQNPGPYKAHVAQAFAGIAGAEGGYTTGAVYNTAYPNLPNYAGPPGPGNLPEYSVGLFGLNLFPQYGQNGSQAAYSAGAQLAANPQAQATTALQLFTQRGFEPWQGDSYVRGAGGPGALFARAATGPMPGADPGLKAASKQLAGSQVVGTPGKCDSSKTVLAGFINDCQLQALKGGLLLFVGGAVMVVGIVLLTRPSVRLPGGFKIGGGNSGDGAAVPASTSSAAVSEPADPDLSLDAAFAEGYTRGQRESNYVRTRARSVPARGDSEDDF